MASNDEARNFVIRQRDGSEDGEFTGRFPRQAALKAARRLEPAPSESEAEPEEIRLRERGTEKLHVYEAWAWEEEAPSDSPEWLGETVAEANVSKQGVQHLDG